MRTHTYTHTHIYVCVCVWHIHTHTHIYICVCVRVCARVHLLVQITNNKQYIFIYNIYILYYITNAPTCFGVAPPSSRSWNISCWSYKILKLIQLHKAVGPCTIKSVLLIKRGSGCKCSSNCSFSCTGVQPFYDRAQQPLLRSTSRAARGKITIRGITSSRNYSQMHNLQM